MRKNLLLSFILILFFVTGCNRYISTVKFYPKETVTEEITEEITEENIKIIYSKNGGEAVELEPWIYSTEVDIPVSEYEEVTIFWPENAFVPTFYLSDYYIFYTYRFYSSDETKVMYYNRITGETREIYGFDAECYVEFIDAYGNYVVWNRNSDKEPIYGSDGTEKYNVCEIMNIETGEIVEFDSLGAGEKFVGFTNESYAIGMDINRMTWKGTIYVYDFLNDKAVVAFEDLIDFDIEVSVNGDIIIEKIVNESYVIEVSDIFGTCKHRFVLPLYVEEVQSTGDSLSFFVRESDGDYIYIYDFGNERLHKLSHSILYDFVCYEDRVYTNDFFNGISLFDAGDMIIDKEYIKGITNGIGVYEFGIYTYAFDYIDDRDCLTFRMYDK